MKKILFLFMMFVGLMSSLHALDTIKIGCDAEKSQLEGASCKAVSAADTDVVLAKVNIWHRDSLMYSWGESGDNRLNIGKSSLALHVQNHIPGISIGKFEVGWQRDTIEI